MLFGLLTGIRSEGFGSGEQGSPHIIFILADDLGWADLPVYGNKFNDAPNITRLAS